MIRLVGAWGYWNTVDEHVRGLRWDVRMDQSTVVISDVAEENSYIIIARIALSKANESTGAWPSGIDSKLFVDDLFEASTALCYVGFSHQTVAIPQLDYSSLSHLKRFTRALKQIIKWDLLVLSNPHPVLAIPQSRAPILRYLVDSILMRFHTYLNRLRIINLCSSAHPLQQVR